MSKKIAIGIGVVLIIASLVLVMFIIAPEDEPVREENMPADQIPEEEGDVVEARPRQYFNKFSPPVRFTQNQIVGADARWLEGHDVDTNPYIEWMEREMGIIFEAAWVTPDWDADVQKLTISAAGGTLPDVIFTRSHLIGSFAEDGLLMPLNDLLENYASPLVEYVIEDNMLATGGMFFMPYIKEGVKYAMPFSFDTPGLWRANWIRQDILEELEMAVPNTIEDLENVLSAFKRKYPESIGLPFDRHLDLRIATTAFEAYQRMWLKRDGILVYGSIQPEMREVLEMLNRWYEAGYMHEEFIAKDGLLDEFTRGEVLTWQGAWWNVHWPFPTLWEQNAEAEMTLLPILRGADGRKGIKVDAVSGLGVAVRNDVENPEALMYLLNESLDSLYRSNDKVRSAMEERGYQFKYPYTPFQEPLNKDDLERITDKFDYDVEGWGFFNEANYHAKFMFGFQMIITTTFQDYLTNIVDLHEGSLSQEDVPPPIWRSFQNRSTIEDPRHLPTTASVVNYWVDFQHTPYRLVNQFVGPPTPTQVDRKALLDTMENETFAKIIMGTLPLEAFDQFVEDWHANGGEQWALEVNEWYQATR